MDKAQAIATVRDKLGNARPSIGSWMQLPSTAVAEIMGAAGYDWVAVDLEHGSFNPGDLPDLFRALELGGTLPLVRVAEGTSSKVKQALEAGAAGIIVPMIESGAQLQAVADACRWPPAGKRGVGFSRANLFGKHFDDYAREQAQSPLLIAMIENASAVDDLEAILAVPGLDAIFIGPYDLSASLGALADFEQPGFQSALTRISRQAAEAGVASGIHVVDPSHEALKSRIAEGHLFIAYSIDAVMMRLSAERPLEDVTV